MTRKLVDDLITKLELATEGNRELDAEIWWLAERKKAEGVYWSAATGLPRKLADDSPIPGGLGHAAVTMRAPHYTTSLDAALTLVPEGWMFGVSTFAPNELFNPSGAQGYVAKDMSDAESEGAYEHAEAKTPALALVIASLKARQ